MKQRVLTAVIGLPVLFVVLFLFETVALNVAVAAIALLAVYELQAATGCWRHRSLRIPTMVFTAAIPFFTVQTVSRLLILICYTYMLALFIVLLRRHQTMRIEQVALSFLFTLSVPFAVTTFVYLRDRWGATVGIFYVLVTLGSAWLSDTGAYFAGRAFGKRKLAPLISPKKTVEGAIGGAVFAAGTMLLVVWLYSLICTQLGKTIDINYLRLLYLMPLLSGVSILGDLSASAIKRQFNVKDYGSIMPGHGGVMDRFDSALLVAPLVYIISIFLPLAKIV